MRTRQTLDRNQAMLLVIDVQTKLLPLIRNDDRVVEATRTLIEAAAVFDLPVTATVQYVKAVPSGRHAGEIMAHSTLAATSVGSRGSPFTSSTVQMLNQRLPRSRARWNAIVSPDGDHCGKRPCPMNCRVAGLRKSTTQSSHGPPR